jgi:ATP-dependent helicase/DNAse subunit B
MKEAESIHEAEVLLHRESLRKYAQDAEIGSPKLQALGDWVEYQRTSLALHEARKKYVECGNISIEYRVRTESDLRIAEHDVSEVKQRINRSITSIPDYHRHYTHFLEKDLVLQEAYKQTLPDREVADAIHQDFENVFSSVMQRRFEEATRRERSKGTSL